MNIDKFLSKAQKSLQAYVNLSVSLQKITLVTSAYQPEIKNLAFNKIKELKNKEEVISFLKSYNYSFLSFCKDQDHDYEGKPDFYINFYFFVYFLSLVQEKYGKKFVQKTLFGQSTFNKDLDQRLEAEFSLWYNQELKKQDLWENFKSFIRAIFKYQETGKAIQEGVSVNESLMYTPPKQALSSVKSPVELTGENLLIKYSPNILRMIYEMGKNLNPVSLIGVQHRSNPVSPKDGIDTNPNLYGESDYNSNYCSDSDSDSDSVSSSDSGLDSLKSAHSDSECSVSLSLSSPLPIEESRQRRKKEVSKNKRSEQERRFYSRREGKHKQSSANASDLGYESGDNVSTGRLQSENGQNLGVESEERIFDRHLELKLEEKLKKCLERKEVYKKLYKRYESYQHNKASKEELIDYQFKFKLNKELYHLYEDYIKKEQDSLSNSVLDSSLAKLLKYYEFKYSINEYKLNKYKTHIRNTEKNGRLKIGGYTLEQLKYYKNKCDKIYTPRLKNYQLLIAVQQPVVQQPEVVQQPAVQQPAVQPPAVQPPAVQPPAVQPPAVQPPAVQQPEVVQPPEAVQQPVVQQPVVQQPVVQQPVVQQPVVQQPVVQQPVVQQPVVQQPVVQQPEVVQPPEAVQQPVVQQPEVVQPPEAPPPIASGARSGNTSAQPVQGNGAPPPPPPPPPPTASGTESGNTSVNIGAGIADFFKHKNRKPYWVEVDNKEKIKDLAEREKEKINLNEKIDKIELKKAGLNKRIDELNNNDKWEEADEKKTKTDNLDYKISILEYEILKKDLEILKLNIEQLTEELGMNNNSRVRSDLQRLKREEKELNQQLDKKEKENSLLNRSRAYSGFSVYNLSEDESDDIKNNAPSL